MKTSPIKFNHADEKIIINRIFSIKANTFGTEEYAKLNQARKDYPNYDVAVREPIKKNPSKEAFKGLDYTFMERYMKIQKVSERVWDKYRHTRLMTECHSRRFPIVKQWFLDTFPEVRDWGRVKKEVDAAAATAKAA